MGLRRHLSIRMSAAATVVVLWLSQPGAAVEPDTLRPAAVARTLAAQTSAEGSSLFRGVGSCSASNCHGGDPDAGTVGAEYSIWVQQDRHAEAYSVLLNRKSRQMAETLGLKQEAHKAAICLNCHSPQRYIPIVKGEEAISSLLDGVSCESCHGGAEKWLAAHIRWDDATSPAEKSRRGFVDTDDLWTRAKMCADCHVGAPGRDVNHDLYAAGHPRLFFEFSAFMASMPIHWAVDSSRRHADWAERPGMEASTWAVGQLATAEAAVDLLVYRAERSKSQAGIRYTGEYPSGQVLPVWPEFSEAACFACHHNLRYPAWRQQRGYAHREPGQLPWGTWTFPLTGVVTKNLLNQDVDSEKALTRLRTLMAVPVPDAGKVAAAGRKVQQAFHVAAQQLPRVDRGGRRELRLTLQQVEALRKAVAIAGADVARENWDGATQVYLALAALERGHRDLRGLAVSEPDDRILDVLMDVRSALEFPPEHDSPRNDSRVSITTIEKALRAIRTSLD